MGSNENKSIHQVPSQFLKEIRINQVCGYELGAFGGQRRVSAVAGDFVNVSQRGIVKPEQADENRNLCLNKAGKEKKIQYGFNKNTPTHQAPISQAPSTHSLDVFWEN